MIGQTVRITADIDFSGITPVRIGGDGVTVMSGTLDGANHTIKVVDLRLDCQFGEWNVRNRRCRCDNQEP